MCHVSEMQFYVHGSVTCTEMISESFSKLLRKEDG